VPVSKALIHSSIRIISIQTNGSAEIGTGFYYTFLSDLNTNNAIPVIVTCKHVIANSNIGILDFSLGKTNELGRLQPHFRVTLTNFESYWIKHPDSNIDVAIMPIGSFLKNLAIDGKRLDWFSFKEGYLLTDQEVAQIGVFQNVKFIGYPIGISDELNNLPIVREGMTATDISIDYEGRKEFMIDAAVFPGSSGSPVVIAEQGIYSNIAGGLSSGNELYLLGILFAGPQYNDKGHIVIQNIPTSYETNTLTSIPCNLGLVIKAEVLNDFRNILFKDELSWGNN
jgi:hypothetical protein